MRVWHVFGILVAAASAEAAQEMQVSVDPVTRCFHIAYPVPETAPDIVFVACEWSPAGTEAWRFAPVVPLVSETALHLARREQCASWFEQGIVREKRAAGLTRTVIFNPYPDAQGDGKVDALFGITVRTPDGETLATYTTPLQADNSDVVCIEDWSQVFQHAAIAAGDSENDESGPQWTWRTDVEPAAGVSHGNALFGHSEGEERLPRLSYPLDLRGPHAVFVRTTPKGGGIGVRFTGEERFQRISSYALTPEILWQWRDLDYQHLALEQLGQVLVELAVDPRKPDVPFGLQPAQGDVGAVGHGVSPPGTRRRAAG